MVQRFIVYGFGGSNAQRDIIDWTLVEAAVRGNRTGLAELFDRRATRPETAQPRQSGPAVARS